MHQQIRAKRLDFKKPSSTTTEAFKGLNMKIMMIDWMHETARCFGYPSDSTRAARERAREATCGYCLRWSGQAQPGRASLNQASASTPSPLLPRLSPLWLNSSPRGLPLAPVGIQGGRQSHFGGHQAGPGNSGRIISPISMRNPNNCVSQLAGMDAECHVGSTGPNPG
jgi:hypothetical protein